MPEAEIVRLLHVAREQNRDRTAASAQREQSVEDGSERASLRRAKVQGLENERRVGNRRAGEGSEDQGRVPDDPPSGAS